MSHARQIVTQHGTMVWHTLCRLLGSSHIPDVEDCFQEVFVAALEVSKKEMVQNWEAMLRRIATRKGLDLLRTRIRHRARHNSDAPLDALPARAQAIGDALEFAELADQMRHALTSLDPADAELFCLRHLEEMSYQDLAAQLGMTPGAVGVALHRIREKLRNRLGDKQSIPNHTEVPHE